MAAKTSSTRPDSTPTISELMTPVHLKRSANLRASMYAPNAAPIANATPGSPTGSVTLTCEASMPRLLSEKPWELVLRFSEPPTPSVHHGEENLGRNSGPEPDTPVVAQEGGGVGKARNAGKPVAGRGIAHEEDDRCEQREHHARAETDAEAGAHGLHGLRCGQRGDGGIGRRTGDLLGRLAWLRRCCRLRGRGWRILELLRRRGLWCHRLRCLRLSGRLCLRRRLRCGGLRDGGLRSCRCGAIGQRDGSGRICGAGAMCGAEDSMVPSSDPGAAALAVPPRSFG